MHKSQKLPRFPDFKPISLNDKELIHYILWEYQPQASEYNFTHLYIWRNYFNFKFSFLDKWLLILCDSQADKPYFFQPVGPENRSSVVYEMLSWLQDTYSVTEPVIKRADEKLFSEIKNSPKLKITSERDYFDYIYNTQDLIELKTKRYHAKRNHLRNFLKQHSYEYKKITSDQLDACIQIEEKWCKQKNCLDKEQLKAEYQAIQSLCDSFQKLKVLGGIIYVEGKPEAFTIGEKLNTNTAVIHIEKADQTIQGLYQLINQQFCLHSWNKIPYINREQDLGIKGLRQAKKSYHPVRYSEKYNIYLKS